MDEKIRALALLSGGLDSTLAARLILDQGIDVVALNFVSPFCLCSRGGCGAPEVARQLGVPLKVMSTGREYLNIVRRPKHGYGKNMNPCIDCRIFMLKRAKRYAKEIGASFMFTGEVLDQRPMSQHYKTLRLIEEEAGLKGRILRPLSAKLLPETLAEKRRLVKREGLLGLRGRSRRPQLSLVKRFDFDCACPSGGCLLAEKEFAARLRDLFDSKKRTTLNDVSLLKVGRHFRLEKSKIIVGRNEAENKTLHGLKSRGDYSFEILGCGSPVAILRGRKSRKAIAKAAALTAYYSDTKCEVPIVNFGKDDLERSIRVPVPKEAEVEELRIRSRD
ncbi:MAG TPA: hypothetical protein VJ574_04260 [Candidatus Bathyarchaeia archaeon]|nr:MAG: hypothetical protein A3K70_00710 [Candidatus Bathyarchaeota archaeon RBG_16_48_13]HJX23609.1 hypothetical protein [Candidatus Bathyarchaeia archaeon]